jgi:hypothetical protein
LSWRYFFILPIVFLTLITVCLVAAAYTATQLRSASSHGGRHDRPSQGSRPTRRRLFRYRGNTDTAAARTVNRPSGQGTWP